MLYIASDHGGFEMKQELTAYLKSKKIAFKDMGPKKYSPKDDYPEFAAKVAREVSKRPAKNNGILICRSGQGVCFVANKFKNVRAALSWNERVAKASRTDDDVNILCLPADYVSPETAKGIVKAWLDTKFSFEQRHIKRLEEVQALE
jgi:RpiB/LacA/LacB family sugar-phosphate isomerase